MSSSADIPSWSIRKEIEKYNIINKNKQKAFCKWFKQESHVMSRSNMIVQEREKFWIELWITVAPCKGIRILESEQICMWNAESGKSFSIQWRCVPLPFSECQRLYWYIFISNSASPFEKKLMDNQRKTSLLQSSSLCRHATLLLLGRSVAWWHKDRLGSRLQKDVTVFSSNSFLPRTSRPLHQKGEQISKI